ncbi:MAG: serine hydrolase domain-containing protein [Caulobacteraceae bacterium]
MLVPAVIQAPAFAQSLTITPISNAEIEQLLRLRAETQHRATGMVIGIIRPSGSSVVAYGPPDGKAVRKMRGDTIFDIASLSKIFTDMLLAEAVVRGEAALDDPLAAYLPPGVAAPKFGDRSITLTDLATHTSGLPLRPINLDALPDATNKYAGYTLDQLYAGLPRYKLAWPPGTQFGYSNVGVALLGQALALRQKTTYAHLLRDRITAPLGLRDTRQGVDAASMDRLARGHDIDLKPIGPTDNGALNPAGGLKSTADDLLRFLGIFLDSSQGELPRAARLMLTIDRPGDDKDTRMALGWRRSVIGRETFYWSNGSGDGSRTFMGFNPARGVAVVALANAASAEGLDDIGRHVLDPALPVNRTVPPIHHQIGLPEIAMNRLLGTYQYSPDDKFVITRGLTGLIVDTGQGQFVIYPESSTHFFSKFGDLQYDFSRAVEGPPPSVVLHQDGKDYTYRRIP